MRERLVLTLTVILLAGLLFPLSVEAQSAGRPILTVRNYTVSPVPVQAGQEFTVVLEIYNNGSRAGENTMAVFTGGDFVPVGETGHVLWQVHINHTVTVRQKMRAPAILSTGVHSLGIELSANDYEGNHYVYPQAIPVEVVGAGTRAVSGPPKVVVQVAETEPAVLSPGLPFTLTLRLANQGERPATRLFVSCADNGLAVPSVGSDLVPVARIAVEQAVTVTVPLLLAWDVEHGGRQGLPVDLEYGDPGGGFYQDQQIIGIEIDAGSAPKPLIVVAAYHANPTTLTAGEPFTLTVRLSNVGTEAARQLAVAFGGTNGEAIDPFLLLDAGQVTYLGDMTPGATVELVRQLVVDWAATGKAYGLPLALSYQSAYAAHHDQQRLNLIVQARPQRRPQLVVAAYRTTPEQIAAGDALTLTVELSNVGTADAERLTLSLGGVDGSALEPFMTVGSGNVHFVGTVAAGERVEVAQPLIVDGAAQAKAYHLPLALSYDAPDGPSTTEVQRLSLIVRRRVELGIEVYSRPDKVVAGVPVQLSLEVLNLGRGPVNLVRTWATGIDTAVEKEGTSFIGPLDPGGSAPVDLEITPRRGGTVSLTVHIEYRDDLNRIQTWSQSLDLEAEAGAPDLDGKPGTSSQPTPDERPAFWQTVFQALKGFLGLGTRL